MAKVPFTEQEVERLRFLAKHFDQKGKTIGWPDSDNMIDRFERYGLVKWISKGSIEILPKILDVVEQLDNPAVPSMKYGVFISHANEDTNLAEELKNGLEQKGVRCFMAKRDIASGARWEPGIREALMASKRILLLLTPRSKDRLWVTLEIGAAWALEKDIVPALVQVSPSELGDPIRHFQARVIETSVQRNRLVEELAEELADPTNDRARNENDGWSEFYRIGDALAESDTAESETLTSAVTSMRR